jgi:hypothetical protein
MSTRACEISPLSAFLSTNLSNKLNTYDELGDRMKRSLGWPIISLEIHQDQLRQNIQIAIEMFTKFAGYTREYLVFNSELYERNKGIRIDNLFTIHRELSDENQVRDVSPNPNPRFDIENPPAIYINRVAIEGSVFATSTELSSSMGDGIDELEVINDSLFEKILTFNPSLSSNFKRTTPITGSIESGESTARKYSNVYDYDILDYRKVIDIVDFEEGSTTGINTLFTIEQTLAQQTHFSYAMGNHGFDLVSWYTVKEFIDTREKMLATRRDIKFDERTQYMQMYPQPNKTHFWGVLSCYVERPIRDLIKEPWVYQYALALSKITIGRVRGKFTGVGLLGGGMLNADILEEGKQEKEKLEQMLYEGTTPGFGDAPPVDFFVG